MGVFGGLYFLGLIKFGGRNSFGIHFFDVINFWGSLDVGGHSFLGVAYFLRSIYFVFQKCWGQKSLRIKFVWAHSFLGNSLLGVTNFWESKLCGGPYFSSLTNLCRSESLGIKKNWDSKFLGIIYLWVY